MQAHLQSCPAARTPKTRQRVANSEPASARPGPGPGLHLAGSEAGLAHDAANLLGAIGLYCSLLRQEGVLQTKHQHYAAELEQLSQKGTSLLRQLLPSLAGSGLRSADAERSAEDVLRALAPILKQLAGPQIELRLDLPAKPCPPANSAWEARPDSRPSPCDRRVDAEALERITTNLVLNAAQAMCAQRPDAAYTQDKAAGRTICVRLRRVRGSLRLSVQDQGSGLPAAIAAELITGTPGEHPACEHGHGHHIVRELAAVTGATVSVRSGLGRGTTIALCWPAVSAAGTGRTASSRRSLYDGDPTCGPCTAPITPPSQGLYELC